MVVGEFTVETELAIIGGGPGGYSAAFRAADLGVQTTLIHERDSLGGAWLHAGCARASALRRAADVIRTAQQATALGLDYDAPRIDLDRLRGHVDRQHAVSAEQLQAKCDQLGITVVHGRATFDNSRQLSIANNPQVPRVRFRRAVIATGSRCRPLPEAGAFGQSPRIIDVGSALSMTDVPARLLVVGGSAAGLELASIYAALGSRVTLIDRSSRLMPAADADLLEPLERAMGASSELRLGSVVTSLEEQEDGVHAAFDGATPQRFDRVIVGIGRLPNLDDLGLERTSVQLDDAGYTIVDDQLRTTDPRIFAVGDVTGDPKLALKAAEQGRIAGEVAAGWGSRFEVRAVPMVVFTEPQLAWCGLTEIDAALSREPYCVARSNDGMFAAIPATHGNGSTQVGFAKLLYDPDTRLVLGAGVVGPGAAELIAEAALAVEMGAVTTDLAATLHPHPTLGEWISSAARRAETDAEGAAKSP